MFDTLVSSLKVRIASAFDMQNQWNIPEQAKAGRKDPVVFSFPVDWLESLEVETQAGLPTY
jgi:hypothetical protein